MSTIAPVSMYPGLTPPFKVRAKYGWSGQAKGDLGFLEGDIMEVTKTTGEWFFGRLLRNERCSGYFPNNFVEIVGEKPGTGMVTNSNSNSNGLQQKQKRVTVPPIPNRASINSSHVSKNKTNANGNNWSSGSSSSSSSLPLSPPMSPRSNGSSLTTPSPGGYQMTKNRYYNSNSNNNNNNYDNYSNYPINRERDSAPEFYEKIRSHRSHPNLVSLGSTPTAAQNTNNNKNINNNNITRRSNITRAKQLNMANISQDSLPPLPPLPSVTPDTFLPSKPVKSFSSNDLSLRLRNHQQQNNMNANFTDHSRGHLAPFSNSKYMDSSTATTATTDSENSFALMSDFSATSAGSFARHRYAESFANSLQRSQQQQQHQRQQTADELNNSNDGYMGSLLKKFLPPRSKTQEDTPTPKLPSLNDLNITTETTDKETKEWLLARTHLNRAKTLTRYEKHPRYMRALERNRDIILHPQDVIYNGLSSNEVTPRTTPGSVDVQIAELNMDYIDKMTRKVCDKSGNMSIEPWAKMTFFSNERYASVLEQLRGIFVFCAETFELVDQDGATNFSVEPPNMDSVLHSRYCTAFQLTWLFKKLANALGIACEIVIGFLKTPGSDNTEFKYNHCWLRVLVNGEWKFVDVILGNITNPIHEFINNKRRRVAGDGYFLVEPLRFIFTHIPAREFEQHIVPSIDQLSALYLPLVFPSFFQNGLKLHNFCPALASLEDMEIYECSLEIPNDIEVFSSVVISNGEDGKSKEELAKFSQMELTLTQVRKHKPESGRKIVLIKAVLPQGANSGTLYVHSGVRGKQTTLANIHPVSMYIPLVHSGHSMDYEFVIRLPHPSAEKVEMYIKEPQNRYLFSGIEYNFVINQNPYDGIIYKDSGRDVRNKSQPMAIRSPSGKIYEMRKTEAQTPYGVWKTNVKVEELGVWTALVRDDSDRTWCEFAQWTCTHET